MAELLPQEHLQPSLLDRLTDLEPEKEKESRDQRVLSVFDLKKCVQRDLSWLLNTTNLTAGHDLAPYDQVATSVVNYGVSDLSGKTLSTADVGGLEREIRQAILDFEPRIMRRSLEVTVHVDRDQMSHNTLIMEIRGEMWGHPLPLELFLKTELDLETGEVNVTEASDFG